MGLNSTPLGDRVHIGIFGKRNAGKSSVINAITGQDLAIVSDILGTTTDPVMKTMELLPLGPVVLIDTPGLDDDGELGQLRIKKTYQILNKTDLAVLVIDASLGITQDDLSILERIRAKQIPYVVVMNKADLCNDLVCHTLTDTDSICCHVKIPDGWLTQKNCIFVSAATGYQVHELKEMMARQVPAETMTLKIVGDLLKPGDFVILVIPIDSAAPKGRLILPQQQTIRDILEAGAISIVTGEKELFNTLTSLAQKPKMVITDSQIFPQVSANTPKDIWLTSFSILFARYKGDLKTNVEGARMLEHLKDGNKILISEGCTHHRQCEDIGTVKLPRWIQNYTGKKLEFVFTSGMEFPLDLSPYSLIVHCGGCTLNEREMKYRLKCAKDQEIPMTNYGMCIAYMNGILKRSLQPFSDIF